MKKGESRFFLNYQMTEDRANEFFNNKGQAGLLSSYQSWLNDDLNIVNT